MTTQTRPIVRFNIFEAADASLWASVPQFGIGPGWDWCVGGANIQDANERAVQALREKIEEECRTVLSAPGRVPTGYPTERLELVYRISVEGFDLVEDPSIPTYWSERRR